MSYSSSRLQKQLYYKKKEEIVWLRPGCYVKCRLVETPVKIVRIFTKDKKCIIVNSEETANNLQAKYPQINVSIRYACWYIDRLDKDKLKILDMPAYVASQIGNRVLEGKKVSELDEGCDWKITTNKSQGMKTEYSVEYLCESPLSALEKKMVEDRKSAKKKEYDLTKVFLSCSFQEADDRLAKLLS